MSSPHHSNRVRRRVLLIGDVCAPGVDFRTAPGVGEGAGQGLETDSIAGYEVEVAPGGGEGVALIQEAEGKGSPFTVVFLEASTVTVQLIETAERLWQADGAVQIVVCSALPGLAAELQPKLSRAEHLSFAEQPLAPSRVLEISRTLGPKGDWARTVSARLNTLEKQATQQREELVVARGKIREQSALLDQTGAAVIVLKTDERIEFWNESAKRLYGWTAGEAVGRKESELLTQGAGSFESTFAILCAQDRWEGEVHHVTKDGDEIIVQTRWSLVRTEQGRPLSILVVNCDVTERRKLEGQFLRVQRMESIGTLTGGIAHDLNNALGPILLAIGLLQDDDNDAPRRQMLEVLETSTARASSMVGQLLQFARGDDGERLLLLPAHLIVELAKLAAETFPKTITVKSTIPEDLWPVNADPTQLYQVLLNLCINARDAMLEGGVLEISAENIVLDAAYCGLHSNSKPGPHVFITVRDTGTGMNQATLERIFEPFFTTKMRGSGTGLGLSTALSIAKAHGGFLAVESRVGVGSSFKFCLPIATEPPRTRPEPMPEAIPGNGELILVVDDEEAVRHVISCTLRAFGYQVVTACNGVEAVAIANARADEIALALIDLMMPVMDGPTTIQELRRINPKLPMIAMSGYPMAGPETVLERAGVSIFLHKPYTAELLLQSLYESLHGPVVDPESAISIQA